jgi:hypothetical protein
LSSLPRVCFSFSALENIKGKYEFKEELAVGQSGTIYLAKEITTGEQF